MHASLQTKYLFAYFFALTTQLCSWASLNLATNISTEDCILVFLAIRSVYMSSYISVQGSLYRKPEYVALYASINCPFWKCNLHCPLWTYKCRLALKVLMIDNSMLWWLDKINAAYSIYSIVLYCIAWQCCYLHHLWKMVCTSVVPPFWSWKSAACMESKWAL